MAEEALKTVPFKQGSFITIEDKEDSSEFYIVRSGKVQLMKETKIIEDTSQPSVLNPGDFFGVVACMANHAQLESAVALTDVSLISIPRGHFGTLIQKNAPIAMKIIRQFSKQLRFYDGEITKLTLKNTEVREESTEHLFGIGEYYFKQKKFNYATHIYKQYLKHCVNGKFLSTATVRLQAMGVDSSSSSGVSLADNSLMRGFANDSMIFAENEPGEELYIIQQGKVKITKILQDKEVLLAVLKEGDIFGEMALLENKPRTASAIAFGDVQALCVNKANFEVMVVQKPQMATRLIQVLSERIWTAYKQLANLLIRLPLARVYDTLLTQVEKQRIPIEHKSSYTFELGPKELINMLGFQPKDGEELINQVFMNKKFVLVNGKIHCSDLEELKKQVEYYKKMEEMERKREKTSSSPA
jgi:CRP/FNR family transcriptional regulator